MLKLLRFPTDGKCPRCGVYMVLEIDGKIVCPVCGYSYRVKIEEEEFWKFEEEMSEKGEENRS